jgi:hypothetical protein
MVWIDIDFVVVHTKLVNSSLKLFCWLSQTWFNFIIIIYKKKKWYNLLPSLVIYKLYFSFYTWNNMFNYKLWWNIHNVCCMCIYVNNQRLLTTGIGDLNIELYNLIFFLLKFTIYIWIERSHWCYSVYEIADKILNNGIN